MPLSPPFIPEEQEPWGRIRLVYKRLPTWEVTVNIFRDYGAVQKSMISERKIERSHWGNIFMKDSVYHRYWQWKIAGGIVKEKSAWAIQSMLDRQRYDMEAGDEWRILLEDTIYPDSFYAENVFEKKDPGESRAQASWAIGEFGGDIEPGNPEDPNNTSGGYFNYAGYRVYNVALTDFTMTQFGSVRFGYVSVDFTATELEILNHAP